MARFNRQGGHLSHLVGATLIRTAVEAFAVVIVVLVHERTGRAAQAGLLLGAAMLPAIVAGPLVGSALDRAARPRLVAAGLGAGFAAMLAVLLTVAGRVPLALAVPAAVAVGCCEPIAVALSGLIPRFVAAHRLSRAYALESASYNLAWVLGPAVVTLVVTLAGAAAAAATTVLLAAAGAALMALLPVRAAEPGPDPRTGARTGGLSALSGGAAVLLGHPRLRAVTVATTVSFLGLGGISVVAVLLAEHLGAEPADGARILTVSAAGALTGALVAGRLAAAHPYRALIGGTLLIGLLLPAAAAAGDVGTAMLIFAALGAAEGPVLAATLAVRQRESPPERLGQVNTTGGSFKICAGALGAGLTAVLAAPLGVEAILVAMGAIQLAGAGAGVLLLRSPAARPPVPVSVPAEVPAGVPAGQPE